MMKKTKKVEECLITPTGNNNNNNNIPIGPDITNILEVRTVAGQAFKNLLDTLKAVLNEANLIFTNEGMKLLTIDSQNLAVVHLFIEAGSFEMYHCQGKVILGVDIDMLQKIIKCNKQNDLMCFIVNNENKGKLEISFENYESGTKISNVLSLLTLKEFQIEDKLEFPPAAEMSSQTFQNIIRDMTSINATKIEISSIRKGNDDYLIFKNKDGDTNRTVSIRIEPNENNEMEDETYQGIFSLKFLKSFAKAANLSQKVRIYLKQFILLEYSASGLGTLKYILMKED